LKEKEKETGAIVTLFMLQNGRLWPASYSSAHPKTDIQFTDWLDCLQMQLLAAAWLARSGIPCHSSVINGE
jgi:hypothetical protein